jgi:putative ATP-dependent endonuclease of the OLD family
VLIADGDQDDKQYFFRVLKESKCTIVEPIDKSDKHSVVYDLLGGNPADLLLPANFMIVEGPSEVKFLNVITKHFYQSKPNIHIVAAGGDDEAQKQTMNGLNKVFSPLKNSPIYKEKLTILFDKPDKMKQSRFESFKNNNNFLEINGQLFLLNVNGLEDYYPQTLNEQCEYQDKVKKAKWMANNIRQHQFEQEMPIMYNALKHCWENAYQT